MAKRKQPKTTKKTYEGIPIVNPYHDTEEGQLIVETSDLRDPYGNPIFSKVSEPEVVDTVEATGELHDPFWTDGQETLEEG